MSIDNTTTRNDISKKEIDTDTEEKNCRDLNNTKVDLDQLYAMISAASASNTVPTKKKNSSLIKKVSNYANKRITKFVQGNPHGIPLGWGINGQVNHWSKVTSMIFHHFIRMDIATIREIIKKRLFFYSSSSTLIHFFSWLSDFRSIFNLLIKFKELVIEERLVYGFFYRTTTDYSYFWSFLDQLEDMKMNLISLNFSKSSKEISLLSDSHTNTLLEQFCDLLNDTCDELEHCLNEEDQLLSNLLSEYFTEEYEHQSLLYATTKLNLPSEAKLISTITYTMYHWIGATRRQEFINSLSFSLQLAVNSIGEKEHLETMNLLKSVYTISKLEQKQKEDEKLKEQDKKNIYNKKPKSNLYQLKIEEPKTPYEQETISTVFKSI